MYVVERCICCFDREMMAICCLEKLLMNADCYIDICPLMRGSHLVSMMAITCSGMFQHRISVVESV
jgi:hypothetical protein